VIQGNSFVTKWGVATADIVILFQATPSAEYAPVWSVITSPRILRYANALAIVISM